MYSSCLHARSLLPTPPFQTNKKLGPSYAQKSRCCRATKHSLTPGGHGSKRRRSLQEDAGANPARVGQLIKRKGRTIRHHTCRTKEEHERISHEEVPASASLSRFLAFHHLTSATIASIQQRSLAACQHLYMRGGIIISTCKLAYRLCGVRA
jgi:hypothetical protein